MPMYNASKYLDDSIQSILKQTYTNFEFIIIDDCSIDNSYSIAQKYMELDCRIKLLSTPKNQNISPALNLGINTATGKYIVRMDADDISHPERLAKQIVFMEAHPEIGVCGTFFKLFANDIADIKGTYRTYSKPEHIKIQMLLFGCAVHHPTLILRRDIFNKYDLAYDEVNYIGVEDHELWNRMIGLGIKFANIEEYLLYYRLSPTQTTQNNQARNFNNLTKLISNGITHLLQGREPTSIINSHIELILKPKTWRFAFKLGQYYKHLKLLKKINQINQIFNQDDFDYIISQYYFTNKVKSRINNYILRFSR